MMNRIDEHRAAREQGKRTRWWKDGLLCASVGAFGGLIASFVYGSFFFVPVGAAVGGVLGALFGDRILPFLQWVS